MYLLEFTVNSFMPEFSFNVQRSVHLKYIPIYIQQDATLHSLFISGNCSTCFGGISTHHQEHTQLYLQYLVLVNRYCYLPLLWKKWNCFECGVRIVLICFGAVQPHQNRSVQFPHHTQTSSNSSTIAAGSSNGLTYDVYQIL